MAILVQYQIWRSTLTPTFFS
uniref:Uncharacterized protein n=1 Tax=Rhizophora mucronata TaxID=61149 RepID=A0A2P2QT11_RHIMU